MNVKFKLSAGVHLVGGAWLISTTWLGSIPARRTQLSLQASRRHRIREVALGDVVTNISICPCSSAWESSCFTSSGSGVQISPWVLWP